MSYFIVKTAEEKQAARDAFLSQNKEVVEFIQNNDRNNFLKHMKDLLQNGQQLTERQLEVSRSIMRDVVRRDLDAQKEVESPVNKKDDSAIVVGDVITVNKMMAIKIGLQTKTGKKFHNVEILEIIDSKPWAITARVVTCYKKVAHCGICSLKLTDPESIALGIGPVCAKNRQVKVIDDLDLALGKVEMVLRIPTSSIKGVFKATPVTETK
jgi:hypothetical protein